MFLEHDDPPVLELPTLSRWYRVQLLRPRSNSLRIAGLVLSPPLRPVGRFDLTGEPTAYFADTPETALYESVFRRELVSCSLQRLRQRALVSFDAAGPVRLADLRGLGEQYPVLVSLRYASTQRFAQDCLERGLGGVIYASAQHPAHTCLALFPPALSRVAKVGSLPLVKPGSSQLLRTVATAALRAQIVLTE